MGCERIEPCPQSVVEALRIHVTHSHRRFLSQGIGQTGGMTSVSPGARQR
jgi:hypothetical protein